MIVLEGMEVETMLDEDVQRDSIREKSVSLLPVAGTPSCEQ